jgi:hypothetical protein
VRCGALCAVVPVEYLLSGETREDISDMPPKWKGRTTSWSELGSSTLDRLLVSRLEGGEQIAEWQARITLERCATAFIDNDILSQCSAI